MIKNRLIMLILLSLFNFSLTSDSENIIKDYFNEIAFGSEFGSSEVFCKKWVDDVDIYVSGEIPQYLNDELINILEELNELIKSVELRIVYSKEQANYIIFFGPGEKYAEIEPAAEPYVEDNWGLFWVYWSSNNEIYRGSMYVDTERTMSKDAQKHLLREELTQSLGLMIDSNKYADSIFYQGWTITTEYSDIDRSVISLLYNEKINPNMNRDDINRIFNW
jgi:Protein of unknown function (DUF2927)